MCEIPRQADTHFYNLIEKTTWEDFYDQIDPIESTLIERNIQTNLETNNSTSIDPLNRKKQKKKEYKRRKREKELSYEIMEEQAKIQLATIIEQIYCQRVSFEEKRTRIQICLSYMDRGQKFHNFLDQVIRIHVQSVQREIQQHTQQLLRLHPVQRNDTSLFYYEFANCLCMGYEHICRATIEIKKIIRLYMLMTQNKDYLGPQYRNYCDLQKDTFAYLIESNLYLKNLIRICEDKLLSNHELKKTHQEELKKLLNLTKVLDIHLGNQDHQRLIQEEGYEESTATSFDDDQTSSYITSEIDNLNPIKNNKTKPKRKNKIREIDLKPEFQDLIQRIQNLQINFEDRTVCCVPQDWLEKLYNEGLSTQKGNTAQK